MIINNILPLLFSFLFFTLLFINIRLYVKIYNKSNFLLFVTLIFFLPAIPQYFVLSMDLNFLILYIGIPLLVLFYCYSFYCFIKIIIFFVKKLLNKKNEKSRNG